MKLGLAGTTVIFIALTGIMLAVFTRTGKEETTQPVIIYAGWKVLATVSIDVFIIHYATLYLFHCIATPNQAILLFKAQKHGEI